MTRTRLGSAEACVRKLSYKAPVSRPPLPLPTLRQPMVVISIILLAGSQQWISEQTPAAKAAATTEAVELRTSQARASQRFSGCRVWRSIELQLSAIVADTHPSCQSQGKR